MFLDGGEPTASPLQRDFGMAEKRLFLDIADLLIVIGDIAMLVGFFMIDWRLAMIFAGATLVVMGLARLRRIERGGAG